MATDHCAHEVQPCGACSSDCSSVLLWQTWLFWTCSSAVCIGESLAGNTSLTARAWAGGGLRISFCCFQQLPETYLGFPNSPFCELLLTTSYMMVEPPLMSNIAEFSIAGTEWNRSAVKWHRGYFYAYLHLKCIQSSHTDCTGKVIKRSASVCGHDGLKWSSRRQGSGKMGRARSSQGRPNLSTGQH